jgi:hypothetical protein
MFHELTQLGVNPARSTALSHGHHNLSRRQRTYSPGRAGRNGPCHDAAKAPREPDGQRSPKQLA